MKTLYLDCGMGAAGDMLTAALLELLPDKNEFLEKLNALGIPDVSFSAEKSVKCGIEGTHVTVKIKGGEESEEMHEHEQSHEHFHTHDHDHELLLDHDHVHEHGLLHTHDHEHLHVHLHGNGHEQIHFHEHRDLRVLFVCSICFPSLQIHYINPGAAHAV